VATIQQANKEIKGYAAEYTILASQVLSGEWLM